MAKDNAVRRPLLAAGLAVVAVTMMSNMAMGCSFTFAGRSVGRLPHSHTKIPARADGGGFDIGTVLNEWGPSLELVKSTYLREVGRSLADWTGPILALIITGSIIASSAGKSKSGRGIELPDDDDDGMGGFLGGGAPKAKLQIKLWNRDLDRYKLAVTKATLGTEAALKTKKELMDGYKKREKDAVAAAAKANKDSVDKKKADDKKEAKKDLSDYKESKDKVEKKADDKKEDKKDAKAEKVEETSSSSEGASVNKRIWVLTFQGASANVGAAGVVQLREEITAIVSQANPETDEVLLRLDSGGGTVTGYGLAGAQLMRLKSAGLKLTVAIDQVAASGGYLMACVADYIICSPFAIIGSIGVVSQLPVVYERLEREGIKFETTTAGQFKRTLDPFKKPTDEDRAKTKEDIEEIFAVFKEFVADRRPSLTIDSVATGETWLGPRALAKGLVDELTTSDDLLLKHARDGAQVYTVTFGAAPAGALQQALQGMASAATAFATRVPSAAAILAGAGGAENLLAQPPASRNTPMARGPTPEEGPWAQL